MATAAQELIVTVVRDDCGQAVYVPVPGRARAQVHVIEGGCSTPSPTWTRHDARPGFPALAEGAAVVGVHPTVQLRTPQPSAIHQNSFYFH